MSSYQWFSYLAHSQQIFIQQKFNTGEKRVLKFSLPADGYCSFTNEVYQFDGYLFHGCEKCSTNHNYFESLKAANFLTKKNIKDLQKATQKS